MALLRFSIEHAEWFRTRVNEFNLGLNADGIPRLGLYLGYIDSPTFQLVYDHYDLIAREAALQITSAFAHQISRDGSWCWYCSVMRDRGDECITQKSIPDGLSGGFAPFIDALTAQAQVEALQKTG